MAAKKETGYECVYVPERAGHKVRFKHHKYAKNSKRGETRCTRCGKLKKE